MPVLHTVNTLSDDLAALRDCIKMLEKDDAIVFMEDAARDLNISALTVYNDLVASRCDIYVLPLKNSQQQSDIVMQITYDDFVDLCCRFPLIQNWY